MGCKKLTLFLLFLLTFSVIRVSAVGPNYKQWSYGPKIGLGITNVHSSENGGARESLGVKSGIVAGIFAEYSVVDWLGISADLLYAQKGSGTDLNFDSSISKTNVELQMRLSYLDIPIMANFYVVKGLALKTGIQPEILLKGQYTLTGNVVYKNSSRIDKIDESVDDTDEFHRAAVSVPVGISYTFEGPGLTLAVQHNIALTDILTDHDTLGEEISSGMGKWHNQVTTFTLALRF